MSINKVRIRNLDDEILNYFRKTEDKIGYDQLNKDVVTEIKNNKSNTNSPYDDAELRNRIINIESTMVSKSSANSLYATKKDYDTSIVIDSKIDRAQENMRNEFDDLKKQFVVKEPGNITEDLLSYDLRRKVNSHTSSTGSSGTGGTSNDVEELKVQVNRNTSDIASLNNTFSTKVYLKENPIQISDLDRNTRLLINNSRQNDVLIGINDLDQSLKNKLDEKVSGSAQNVIDTMYKNGSSGQVLIVDKTQAGNFSTQLKHIFRNDIFIFKLDEKYLDNNIEQKDPEDPENNIIFDAAKTYAKNNEYTYIANIGKESLLTYNKNTNSWTEDTKPQTVYSNMVGCFVLSYPDNIIYYCKDFRQLIEIFNPNDYVKEQDIENTIEYFDNLSEKKLDLNSMIDIESTTEPKNAQNGTFWVNPSNVTYIKTDSGWVRLS